MRFAEAITGLTNEEVKALLAEALMKAGFKGPFEGGLQGGPITEMWPEFCIVNSAGKYYRVFYTVEGRQVKLGAQEEVVEAWAPVKSETSFSSRGSQSFLRGGNAGDRAVQSLKRAGRWMPEWDAKGLPQIFAHVARIDKTHTFADGARKTTLEVLTNIVGAIADNSRMSAGGRIPISPQSLKFSERIAERMSAKNISYGRAMSDLAQEDQNFATFAEGSNPQGHNRGSVYVDPKSLLFHEAIEERMQQRSITYGEAMTQLTQEGWHER